MVLKAHVIFYSVDQYYCTLEKNKIAHQATQLQTNERQNSWTLDKYIEELQT